MRYYYNESEHSFFVATNFIPTEIPQGYVEITQEQYKGLIEADMQDENETAANNESI